MRVTISSCDLQGIKRSLRIANSDIGASRRLEAAARSLGFNTFAGFRSALFERPIDVEADDARYRQLLGLPAKNDKGWPVRPLSRALARTKLSKVLDANPTLTWRGFDSIFFDQGAERQLPRKERLELLAERRRCAYESDRSADQFELAYIYLSRQKRTQTTNRTVGSYGLKHRAEGLSRDFGLFLDLGDYVSNGMMIAAAYALGFNVKPIGADSYNAYFNISMQTIKPTYGKDNYQLRANTSSVQRMYGPIIAANAV